MSYCAKHSGGKQRQILCTNATSIFIHLSSYPYITINYMHELCLYDNMKLPTNVKYAL